MTSVEKEKVITDAIQRLVKNKGLNLSINKMHATKNYFDVILNYTAQGEEKQQGFSFSNPGFDDQDDLDSTFYKDLRLPTNLSDYQKVVLKLAYYFYNWYRKECR